MNNPNCVRLVINSVILVILINDSAVLLLGEIRHWSLVVFSKGFKYKGLTFGYS